MEWLKEALDAALHVDRHLLELIDQYHSGIYAILFAVIFCETGLVVTPFLPGDSLLFAGGIFARKGLLDPWALSGVIVAGAFLGDNTNYFLGKTFGERLFRNEKSRWFKRSHLTKTHAFFERHGAKTIILARFVPIVRTFAPFVAGMGAMEYRRFIGYSLAGSGLWVTVCVGAGYLFGMIPAVRDNFSMAVLGMIGVSLVPAVIEVWRHKRRKAKHASAEAAEEPHEPV